MEKPQKSLGSLHRLRKRGRKETFKGIIPLSASVLVKSIAEYRRDEFLNVKMFIKELEERGDIINKQVLAV